MAPSAVVKHRFQNSLDMIAARSLRTGDRSAQSGTGNAWCIMDSPTLGRMPNSPRRGNSSLRLEESTMATGSRLASQAVSVAPLNVRKNVKKNRRRGLISGVALDLPPSPLPTPSPPHTSITFTAEWDLTQKSFIFTPFNPGYPLAPTAPHFMRDMTPIPVNVDEDVPYSPPLSAPSVYSAVTSPHHPCLSAIQTTWTMKGSTPSIASRSTSSPDSTDSSPCTPVSPIFDDDSMYSHGRKLSQSTVASSVTDLSDEEDVVQSKMETEASARSARSGDKKAGTDNHQQLDRDLLLTPLSAFEQMMYEQMVPEPRSIRRTASTSPIARPNASRRPLPDVPITAKSTFSIYSSQSHFSPVSPPPSSSLFPAGTSLRDQLHAQISKTLFGGLLHKRSS